MFLEYQTMDKVQNPSNPECLTPSSEPFRIYMFGSCRDVLHLPWIYSHYFLCSRMKEPHRGRDFGSPEASTERARATLSRMSHTIDYKAAINRLPCRRRPWWLLLSVGNRYFVTDPVLTVCVIHWSHASNFWHVQEKKTCLWQSVQYSILILYTIIRVEMLSVV
jgi:hypothetical protein